VLSGRAEAGDDERGAELVAVQGGGVRFVVQPWPANMHGGRVIQEFFLDGVPVGPGDGAQPAGDGGAGAAAGLQVAGEALDIGAAGAGRARWRVWHQVAYWHRSSSQAWRVRPLYPARNPAKASRSATVRTSP